SYNDSARENLPYDIKTARKASNYQVVVDAILDAGAHEISYNGDKPAAEQVTGRIGDASRRAGLEWRTGTENLWAAMKLAKVNRAKREQIAQFLQDNPEVAAAYLEPLIGRTALVAIGDGVVANWVTDALMAKTAEEAEMIFWRGRLLSSWNALGLTRDED